MTDRDGAAYSFADGHAGDGVSAVTLILDDGTNVQATVANGWFVAWWPSAQNVKSAELTTPAGTTTQPASSRRHASPVRARRAAPPAGLAAWSVPAAGVVPAVAGR